MNGTAAMIGMNRSRASLENAFVSADSDGKLYKFSTFVYDDMTSFIATVHMAMSERTRAITNIRENIERFRSEDRVLKNTDNISINPYSKIS